MPISVHLLVLRRKGLDLKLEDEGEERSSYNRGVVDRGGMDSYDGDRSKQGSILEGV